MQKETVEQEEHDKVLEELAKFEIKQRKADGDEEGHEQLSKYWLKLKIYQLESDWTVEKFKESYPTSTIPPGEPPSIKPAEHLSQDIKATISQLQYQVDGVIEDNAFVSILNPT